MKKQTGGKLTCNRVETIETNDNCVSVSCVDYEKGIFNSKTHRECPSTSSEWIKYYDEDAKSNYWYNPKTGVATWIPQTGGKSKKRQKNETRQKKRKTNKKRKTKRNKKI